MLLNFFKSSKLLYLFFLLRWIPAFGQDKEPVINFEADTIPFETNAEETPSSIPMYEDLDPYPKTIKENKFDREKWKSVSKDLDYTETKENPKEEKRERVSEQPSTGLNIDPNLLKIILYGTVICLILFIIYKMYGKEIFKKNKKISEKKNISFENIEEEIHESDLDIFLREALQKRDFKIAIRIYYLMAIKELSLKEWIEWKKNKTNREYLYEMIQRNEYKLFSELTGIFERVWYGDWNIREEEFQTLAPSFQNFINTIKKQS